MLIFVQITHNELVQGTKYKIEENFLYYLRTFICIYDGKIYECDINNEIEEYTVWKNISFVAEHTIEKNIIKRLYLDSIQMSEMYLKQIYKLVSSKEKIQNAMETRAINTILQNIIGDKTFVY